MSGASFPVARPPARSRRLRKLWRRRVVPIWRDNRPLVVIAATVTMLVLGTIGWHKVPDAGYSWFDAFYKSLSLFGVSADQPNPPIELQIARIIGPIITGYAAVRGLVLLARDQMEVIGIRLFMRE